MNRIGFVAIMALLVAVPGPGSGQNAPLAQDV